MCLCVGGDVINVKCYRNPIASFFNMLHAFTSGCRMNQDFLAADDSLSVIGALLQKVSSPPSFTFLSYLISYCVEKLWCC